MCIYIYKRAYKYKKSLYIYMCVCVCVYVCISLIVEDATTFHNFILVNDQIFGF